MNEILIFVSLFVVRFVDLDYDNKYNVMIEDPRTGTMVAYRLPTEPDFKVGQYVELKIKGECTKVYEVLEGNGKRGSPWRAEDDWYVNRRPYICNAIEVNDEKVD